MYLELSPFPVKPMFWFSIWTNQIAGNYISSSGCGPDWSNNGLIISNNDGFPVLKAECVTLSFYLNPKRLNVQGMKDRETRQKILSWLLTKEFEDFGPSIDDCGSQVGSEIEGDGDHEGDEVVAQAEEDNTERIQNTSTWQTNVIHCCCDKSTAAVIDLSKKFALLEAEIEQWQLSPSHEELLAKIKALEDDRDSLLTALRLLKEEFDQNGNDHRNKGRYVFPWWGRAGASEGRVISKSEHQKGRAIPHVSYSREGHTSFPEFFNDNFMMLLSIFLTD